MKLKLISAFFVILTFLWVSMIEPVTGSGRVLYLVVLFALALIILFVEIKRMREKKRKNKTSP